MLVHFPCNNPEVKMHILTYLLAFWVVHQCVRTCNTTKQEKIAENAERCPPRFLI